MVPQTVEVRKPSDREIFAEECDDITVEAYNAHVVAVMNRVIGRVAT